MNSLLLSLCYWTLSLRSESQAVSVAPPLTPSPLSTFRRFLPAHDMTEKAALAAAASDAGFIPGGAPAECHEWLDSVTLKSSFVSQFGQDASIYYNFLAGHLANGHAGVYVDAGTNMPRRLSNTYFLDKCLGWRGLCIEANPVLAGLIAAERSCTVVNKCIAGSTGVTSLEFYLAPMVDGYSSGGHIATDAQRRNPGSGKIVTVACEPLAKIMKDNGMSAGADFLSIDIEGNEVPVMSMHDWATHPFDIVLIEAGWATEELDMAFHDAGMWKVTDLAYLDDLYVRAPKFLRLPGFEEGRAENWGLFRRMEAQRGFCVKRRWGVPGAEPFFALPPSSFRFAD